MDVQIKTLVGPWPMGYALHKHVLSSQFMGEDANGNPTFHTIRSEPGEALFRLKYRGDRAQAVGLAQALAKHIVPRLGDFDRIVSMPASNARQWQPVEEVANALAQTIGKPWARGLLVKSATINNGPALKDLGTKEEKTAALAGRFVVNEPDVIDRRIKVLLLDDLFDTGASMEAAYAALSAARFVSSISVAALTWK